MRCSAIGGRCWCTEGRADAEMGTAERIVQSILEAIVEIKEIAGSSGGNDEPILDRIVLKFLRQDKGVDESRLRSAPVRSGTCSRVSCLQRCQAWTPSLSFARCSEFAIHKG